VLTVLDLQPLSILESATYTSPPFPLSNTARHSKAPIIRGQLHGKCTIWIQSREDPQSLFSGLDSFVRCPYTYTEE